MQSRRLKNIAVRIVGFGALVALLWLWSRGPIYGIWIFGLLLGVGAFLACRRQGWLFVFVLPLSFVAFLFGVEDGSFKLRGISELYENRAVFLHFVAALVLVWSASLIGALK